MPQKIGIDYFPLDVALDSKFELIEAEYGLTGFAVVVKLLQRIYSGQGYYCEWTNEVALLFGKSVGLGGNVVSEIVSAAIKREMFDRDLYDRYRVLTSRGIQKRYFEAVSRRKEISVKSHILLVQVDQICPNAHIARENVNITAANVDISLESKEEKRRVKKSRVEGEVRPRKIKDEIIAEFGTEIYDLYLKKTEAYGYDDLTAHQKLAAWIREDVFKGKLKPTQKSSFDVKKFEAWAFESVYGDLITKKESEEQLRSKHS